VSNSVSGQEKDEDCQWSHHGQHDSTIPTNEMQGFFAALRMTDVRLLVSLTRAVAGEAEAGELPAGGWGEEVSVGGADVGGGGDA